jgi:sporulation protein YlmC with PRC-barrel domain
MIKPPVPGKVKNLTLDSNTKTGQNIIVARENVTLMWSVPEVLHGKLTGYSIVLRVLDFSQNIIV